ncbi:MAG: hypothetical protein ACK55X_04535 [Synechococcaceae cyanobacterium]|jgi:hypothetical protein
MSSLQQLRGVLGRIVHRSSLPYTSLPLLGVGASLSDQFLYRGDLAGNRFVAENSLALLSGESVPMTHRLSFFDSEGRFLGHQDHVSSRLFSAIDLADPGAELASYIHTSLYAPHTLQELASHRPELTRLRRLHRGYALYRRTPQSIYSAVHGNVGGMRLVGDGRRGRTRHLARRRGWFLYTPQYRFTAEQTLSLYLINPCRQPERIAIGLASVVARQDPGATLEPLAELSVPGRGVRNCRLEGLSGYLTLRSRLPMCRPLIFVETGDQPAHLDVFHT